jgi:hypothetical protein
VAPGAAPAVAAVVIFEPGHQGVARGCLKRRIQRGAHIEAAGVQLVADIGVGQGLTTGLLDEEVGVGVLGALGGVLGDQGTRAALDHLLLGDPVVLRHLAQNPVAPALGRAGVAFRMVVVRPLGQGGEEGRLVRRQLLQRLAEIVVGGRGHAVGPVAEEDLVQIEFEDLFLAQGRFQTAGEDGLLQLASDGRFIGQQNVLGDLLGDGRAAFQPPSGDEVEHVLEHGPAQTRDVDAAVLEEILVLGRHEGVDDLGRDLFVGHIDAPLVRELTDQGAVASIDARRGRRTVVGQFGGVRQVVEQPGRIDGDHQPGQRDSAQQADARPHEPAFRNLHHQLRATSDFAFRPRRRAIKGAVERGAPGVTENQPPNGLTGLETGSDESDESASGHGRLRGAILSKTRSDTLPLRRPAPDQRPQ